MRVCVLCGEAGGSEREVSVGVRVSGKERKAEDV